MNGSGTVILKGDPVASAPESALQGLSPMWAVMVIAGILYGSWIPFDLRAVSWSQINPFGMLHAGFIGTSLEDVVTNLLLYVPVGIALVLCGDCRSSNRTSRILKAVLIGAATSLLAETVQVMIAMRVASWLDVALNTLGTFAGALLGVGAYRFVRAALRDLLAHAVRRPFAVLSGVLVLGLFVAGVAPFDFITNTQALHASFARADWTFGTAPAVDGNGASLAELARYLPGVAWYALLGGSLVLARRESGWRHHISLFSAVKMGVILAALVEVMQVLTVSHVSELRSLVFHIAAVVGGAWCGAFVVGDSGRSAGSIQLHRLLSTKLIAAAVAAQVVIMLLVAFSVAGRMAVSSEIVSVDWLPFESLWHQPMAYAAHAILATLLVFGLLAVTVAILLRRVGLSHQFLAAITVVTLFATTLELLRLGTGGGGADVTNPLLALLAAVIVARALPIGRRAFAAARQLS